MRGLPTTFGIFGTCDSVDVFEFSKRSEIVHHVPMRAGSILTADISRTHRSIHELNHNSSLATMILRTILNGEVFEFMRDNAGEYLVIDLVEERMPFISFGEYLFLYSPWFRDSNLKKIFEKEYEINFIEHETLDEEFLKERIKKFCEKVLLIYPEDKIIINEVLLSSEYIDAKGEKHYFEREEYIAWEKKASTIIKKMYALLKENLPMARVLEPQKYFADTNNIRGLSPCHFTNDYYQKRYQELLSIVEEDYAKKRKIIAENVIFDGKIDIRKKELLKLGLSNICAYFLGICEQFTKFENKKVLWIGEPTIDHDVVRKMKIKKFVYLSGKAEDKLLEDKEYYNFKDRYVSPRKALYDRNFAYYMGTVEQLKDDFCDFFDIVVVINEFEHVKNMDTFLDNIYKCLRYGGHFFAKPGRIWASPYGSEWNINGKLNYLNCRSDQILPYPHLLSSISQIYDSIRGFCTESEIGEKAFEIKNGSVNDPLNRFFYEDYKFFIENSLFSIKEISPLGKVIIEKSIEELLIKKYGRERTFNFNTIFVHCMK